MTPPRARLPSCHDETPTGLEAPSSLALLGALRADVSEMRSELSTTSGVVIRIEERQRDVANKLLEHERRIVDVERGAREAQTASALRDVRVENDIASIKSQLCLLAPLVGQHEQAAQQRRGAIVAAKALYALIGVLTSGTAIALYHALRAIWER